MSGDMKAMKEAQSLQVIVSRADWAASNANVSVLSDPNWELLDDDSLDQIPGMKRLLQHLFGYGPLPRGPLGLMSEAEANEKLIQNEHIKAILALERKLESAK